MMFQLRRWKMEREMPLRVWFVAVSLLVSMFSAESLQAQDVTVDAVRNTQARDAIRSIIADARTKGIPDAPLLLKVREGVAKGSEPERIRVAVGDLAGRLERAQRALTPVQSVDEVSAGAAALHVKVPDQTIRGMRQSWPDRTLTVPLGVLTELVAQEVPVKLAAKRVQELLERGATSAHIVSLGDTVRMDIAAGRAPDASMELRTKGVLTLLANPAGVSLTTETRNAQPPKRPKRN